MDFLKGLFTRKSPLSSRGYNAVPRNNGANVVAGNNPMYSNNAARAPFKNLLNAYTRHNVSSSEKAQAKLVKLRNLNRNSYLRFLNTELNRERSVSGLSNDDVLSIRGLADPQLGGRLYRKTTRRNRRNRSNRNQRNQRNQRNRKTRRN